jgi:hypothetical protein
MLSYRKPSHGWGKGITKKDTSGPHVMDKVLEAPYLGQVVAEELF